MMKRTIVAAAAVLAISGAANATSPILTTPSGHFIWQGDMIINAATPATPAANCTAFNVGKLVAQVMFAPRGLPNNDPKRDKFMWFPVGELTAQQWVSNTPSTSGLLDKATSVAASGVDSGGLYTSTTDPSPITSFSVSPPTTTTVPTKLASSIVTVTLKAVPNGCSVTAVGHLIGPY